MHERRSCNTAGFTRRVNSSFSGQNDRHFTDDIFKYIFLNENILISIEMSLKFIPSGPTSDIPALVQIMTWRRPGDKPLSEEMLTRFTEAYMREWGVGGVGDELTMIYCHDGLRLILVGAFKHRSPFYRT